MMRITRRMTAFCLSLLILIMNAAQAEASFLVFSNGWHLEDTPVEVLLKADVGTHMPFDDERLAMLTPITDMLSLRLMAGKDQGSVTIAIAEQEVLSLQYKDQAVQLSSLPEITFTADQDPLSLLLGSDVSVEDGYAALGLNRDGEALLTDGRTLLELLPSVLEKYGKRTKSDTKISGYGQSAYRYDYTVAASKADEVHALLLSVCPDGWLREIIGGLTFSGKQTLRMYFTEEDVLLRAEYNGSCGPEDDLRTVKLVLRTRHDAEMDKDYLELTSPAKKGKDKNNLTFERTVQTNKQGERTIEGNFNYTVTDAGITSIRKADFSLKNAFSDTADKITGSVTFENKLNGAESYTSTTWEPELTISGSDTAPYIEGTLSVTEKYAGRTTEHAIISIALTPTQGIEWEDREQSVDLSALDEKALAEVQMRAASTIATAIVHPLIVMMGEDAVWFFRDLPEDAVQKMIETAEMPAE